MRFARLLLGGTAVVCSALVAAPSGAQSGGTAAETGGAAIPNLLECVAQNQEIAAVLLIDESRSLRSTDKEGSRVELSSSIVAALNSVASVPIDGRRSRLDLLVVGFGSDVSANGKSAPTDSDWIDVKDAAALEQAVEQTKSFAKRNSDNDTDYVDALAQAQSLLGRHASLMDPNDPDSVCTAVLLFTDGSFDLTPSSSRRWWAQDLAIDTASKARAAIRRGTELLCQPQGVSDQLRRRPTYLLTFALLSERFSGTEEALLKGITLGLGDCGAISGAASGVYFAETGVGQLADCFLLTLVGAPCAPPQEPIGCSESSPCVETFQVDDSVAGFRLVVIASPSLESTVLVAPSGATQALFPGGSGLLIDGTAITVDSANGRSLITATIPEGTNAALGTWSVRHAPQAGGTLRVEADLDSAYRLRLTGPDDVVRGRESFAQLQIVGRSGAPVSADGFSGNPALKVVIVDGDRTTEAALSPGEGPTTFRLPVLASPEGTSSRITLRASGSAVSKAGAPIDLGSDSLVLNVARPGLVRPPAEVQLGTLRAERATERNADGVQPILPLVSPVEGVAFTGAPEGSGKVCLVESDLLGPAESAPRLRAEVECIDVAASTETVFPLTIDDQTPRAGEIGGTVRFRISSDSTGNEQVVDIPVRGSVLVPLPDSITDSGRLWLLFIIAVAVPLVLYLALAWLSARFKEPSLVMAEALPFVLTSTGLAASGGTTEQTNRRLEHLYAGGRHRRVTGAGLELRSPVRLFRMPIAHVSSIGGGPGVVGSQGITTRRSLSALFRRSSGVRGKIAHQLHGQWVFEPEPGAATNKAVPGRLVVLLRGDVAQSSVKGESRDAQSRVIREASEKLVEMFDDVAGLAGSPEQSADGTGGSPSSPTRFISMFDNKR